MLRWIFDALQWVFDVLQGVLPVEDVQVCAISVYLEHEPTGVFDFELEAAFPSFERGCLHVRGLTRGSGRELPRNMKGKQVLLLAPVVKEEVDKYVKSLNG